MQVCTPALQQSLGALNVDFHDRQDARLPFHFGVMYIDLVHAHLLVKAGRVGIGFQLEHPVAASPGDPYGMEEQCFPNAFANVFRQDP